MDVSAVKQDSVRNKGDCLEVLVYYDNQYANEMVRKYEFRQKRNRWYYRYREWTGKRKEIENLGLWNRVTRSRLANDILYIIMH